MAKKAAVPKSNYEPPVLEEKTQDDFLAELADKDPGVAAGRFAFNASPACSAELTRSFPPSGAEADSAAGKD